MGREVILEAKNISKIYGRGNNAVKALDGLDLKIYEGETVAIVGKSGSGKSTLMHLLALLDKASTGSITLEGKNTRKLRGRKLNKVRNKKFGFVFQSFYMNANDSVLSNVMLPLRIAGASYLKARKTALTALKIVGLKSKAKQKAKNLSGGQKQRVCIARAIVNLPEIIFADEPTGNLDSTTGDNIMNLLFALNKKSAITLIIVTHDADLAKKCDRQIHLVDGKITEIIDRQPKPVGRNLADTPRPNLGQKPLVKRPLTTPTPNRTATPAMRRPMTQSQFAGKSNPTQRATMRPVRPASPAIRAEARVANTTSSGRSRHIGIRTRRRSTNRIRRTQ